MGKAIIRSAKTDDMESLAGLLEQLFALEENFTFDKDLQKRGIELFTGGCTKHRKMLVAEVNDEVVGMCSLQIIISTAEGGTAAVFEDMIVDSRHRGNGIGKKLIDDALSWARGMGIQRVQLLADKNNRLALDFYRKQGWESTSLVCLRKRICD